MSTHSMVSKLYSEMAIDRTFAAGVNNIIGEKLLRRWDNSVAHYNVGMESPDEAQWCVLTGLRSPYEVACGL